MKIICKLLTALLLMSAAFTASSQAVANASVTATILTAISITKIVDMNFGNISVQAQSGGTVILSTAGIRSATGGVTLPATNGTVTAASFTVMGQDLLTYSITLPVTPFYISIASKNKANMTVTAFLSNPSNTGILSGGTQTLTVGATLNIAAAQPDGIYTSTSGFVVTVNYN